MISQNVDFNNMASELEKVINDTSKIHSSLLEARIAERDLCACDSFAQSTNKLTSLLWSVRTDLKLAIDECRELEEQRLKRLGIGVSGV